MENCSTKSKRRGNATVYTIAALLVVGFIGTALIKMAQHDVIGGTDYYQASRARVAAKAGLQKFERIVNQLPDSIVQVVYNMVVDTFPNWWVVGDGANFEDMGNNSSYRVQAVGIDSSNFTMHLVCEGRSGNSRATMHAVYELGNIEVKTDQSIPQDFALYIGDVNFNMYGPIDVNGKTRISGDVDFDLLASGSRFRQLFRTSVENSFQMWRGTYTFDTIAYFGTEVHADGNTHFYLMKESGFDPRVAMTGSNNTMDFYGDIYANANFTGAIALDAHNHDVIVTTAFNSGSPNPGWVNFTEVQTGLTGANAQDIRDSLSISKIECMPLLDPSVIPVAKILSWNSLRNSGLGGGSSILPSPWVYAPAWNEVDGKMANNIWAYANANGKLWNGYAVVSVDQQCIATEGPTNDIFTQKIIFIVRNTKTLQADGNGDMFRTSATASLVLFAQSGGTLANIGHWTTARGYIYTATGGRLDMGGSLAPFDPFVGAIHVADGATMNWYPAVLSGVPTITFDADVIADLMVDEFLTFPCDTSANAIDSIVFIDGFQIDERLLGINY